MRHEYQMQQPKEVTHAEWAGMASQVINLTNKIASIEELIAEYEAGDIPYLKVAAREMRESLTKKGHNMKKKEQKARKVRITFTATIEPYEGKRFSQKAIKEEIQESLTGGSISSVRSFEVEELEERC